MATFLHTFKEISVLSEFCRNQRREAVYNVRICFISEYAFVCK